MGGPKRGSTFKITWEKYFKISFSRTNAPKMPIFLQKPVHVCVVMIQNCKNRGPKTITGAAGRVQSLTCIGKCKKNLLKSYNAIVWDNTLHTSWAIEDSNMLKS